MSNGGEGGGDAVLLQARCDYCDDGHRIGRVMAGKVAATLFVHKHVVSIVKVVLLYGTI